MLAYPIDNNEDERALKLVIRNRNNSLFYKTFSSATLSDYMQSLIYSAAQNNINPFNYLKGRFWCIKKKFKIYPSQWLPGKITTYSLQVLEKGTGMPGKALTWLHDPDLNSPVIQLLKFDKPLAVFKAIALFFLLKIAYATKPKPGAIVHQHFNSSHCSISKTKQYSSKRIVLQN